MAEVAQLKHYRLSPLTLATFTLRRAWKGSLTWGIIFGLYVFSKVTSYVKSYTTVEQRHKIATELGSNVGFKALLGSPHLLQTVAGFTVWNCLNILALMASIWGIVLATKLFRGEEDNGRQEVLLSGQTSQGGAASKILMGLILAYLVVLIPMSLLVVSLDKMQGVGFSSSASLFFALAVTSPMLLFMAVGALCSQFMPTRSRAITTACAIFGIFFLLRVIGDSVNSARWLLSVSPLGWVERMQPLYASRPVWLIPMFILTLILAGITVFVAANRDLGDSWVADKDTAKAKFGLLNSQLAFSYRLTRTKNFIWLLAIVIVSVVYGLITDSANEVLNASGKGVTKAIHKFAITGSSPGATLYVGVIFFMLMLVLMVYSASAANNIRQDEASGYLDNLMVQPVSRMKWLWSRLLISLVMICAAGLAAGLCVWISLITQHTGISFHQLILAGINIISPAILVIGFAILGFGFLPRATATLAYGIIAWSFLMELLGDGLKLNHWLLDTSILHQIPFAPAVSPDWTTSAIVAAVGIFMAIVGSLRFTSRDLQTE